MIKDIQLSHSFSGISFYKCVNVELLHMFLKNESSMMVMISELVHLYLAWLWSVSLPNIVEENSFNNCHLSNKIHVSTKNSIHLITRCLLKGCCSRHDPATSFECTDLFLSPLSRLPRWECWRHTSYQHRVHHPNDITDRITLFAYKLYWDKWNAATGHVS